MSNRNQGISLPTSQELHIIIRGEDDLKSAKETDKLAQSIGRKLSHSLSSSQIRNIFGKVRQIEMNWAVSDDNEQDSRRALRDLILLKPKLAYQSERKKEVEALADLLMQAIDMVENRDHFQRFVDLFEAILAYHKAAGGK